MTTFQQPRAAPVMVSAMDLFTKPVAQVNFQGVRYERLNPTATYDHNSPVISFSMPPQTDLYTWPSQSILKYKMTVKTKAGTVLPENSLTYPANNMFHTNFRKVEVLLNGVLITPSTDNYPYRAYMDQILSYNKESADTWMNSLGWSKDTATKFDNTLAACTNLGAKERNGFIAQSKIFDMEGRLALDLFQQGRVIPTGVSMDINLYLNNPAFSLVCGDTDGRQIALSDAVLEVCHPIPTASTAMAHTAAWRNNMITYPMKRTITREFVMGADRMNHTIDNMTTMGQIPRRVVVGLVNNAAKNGAFANNPFNFQHYNVNKMQLSENGQIVNGFAYEPNFTDDHYLSEYLSMFKISGKMNSNESVSITREEYKGGYTFYCFDLSADLSGDCPIFDRSRSGNLRLDMSFTERLPHTVSVFVRMEYDNTMRVDTNKSVGFDWVN